jgi:hypothetical protein
MAIDYENQLNKIKEAQKQSAIADLENTRKSMGNSFGTGYEAVIDRIGLIESKINGNDSDETRDIIVSNAREALVILEKSPTKVDS